MYIAPFYMDLCRKYPNITVKFLHFLPVDEKSLPVLQEPHQGGVPLWRLKPEIIAITIL